CSNAPLLRTKKSLQRAVQTRRCCVRKSLCKELFKRAAVAYEKVSAKSCSNAPLLRTKKSLQRAVQTRRCCVRKSLCNELFKRAAVAYEKVSAKSCSNEVFAFFFLQSSSNFVSRPRSLPRGWLGLTAAGRASTPARLSVLEILPHELRSTDPLLFDDVVKIHD